MAIHFDFIVSEEEANTIFECITDVIENEKEEEINLEMATSYNESVRKRLKDQVEWSEKRIKYLEDLKSKMKNTKVV